MGPKNSSRVATPMGAVPYVWAPVKMPVFPSSSSRVASVPGAVPNSSGLGGGNAEGTVNLKGGAVFGEI